MKESQVESFFCSLVVDLDEPHERVFAVVGQVASNSEVASIEEIGLHFLPEKTVVGVLEVFPLLLLVAIVAGDEQQVIVVFVHLAEAPELQGEIDLLGSAIAAEERVTDDLGRNYLVVC